MKKIFKSGLVLIFVLFVFSCKKKDATTTTNTKPTTTTVATTTVNGSMIAKVNGNNWVSINNGASNIHFADAYFSEFHLSGETSSDQFQMSIYFKPDPGGLVVGSHDIHGTLNDVSFTYGTKSGSIILHQDSTVSGNLVLTSVSNGMVSGTFNFILHKKVGFTAGADSITNITSGVFTNIKYKEAIQ